MMTREQFRQLPHLLMEHHVVALGYGRATVAKFVDCGVLKRICPKGCGQARYQKRQLAQLLKWEDLLELALFVKEPPLIPAKTVRRWTGWSETTLTNMTDAGGLDYVKPPGAGKGRFRKGEIEKLIGFDNLAAQQHRPTTKTL